ncbi:MAG: NAD(P)-binding domain-containing protein [Candidatus Deferrimicrobiaceae bacterium]
MRIAMVGLGKMGMNMTRRLLRCATSSEDTR